MSDRANQLIPMFFNLPTALCGCGYTALSLGCSLFDFPLNPVCLKVLLLGMVGLCLDMALKRLAFLVFFYHSGLHGFLYYTHLHSISTVSSRAAVPKLCVEGCNISRWGRWGGKLRKWVHKWGHAEKTFGKHCSRALSFMTDIWLLLSSSSSQEMWMFWLILPFVLWDCNVCLFILGWEEVLCVGGTF